jgi:cytochrome c biogenesis protein CcdA
VAVIGLLVAKTTYWTGVNYLLLYNLMFVMPLIIILILTSNPYTLVKFGEWQQKNKRTERLIMGLVMMLIGAIILIFLI